MTSRIKLIANEEFCKVLMDKISKIFMRFVAVLRIEIAIVIYLSRVSRIQGPNNPTLTTL